MHQTNRRELLKTTAAGTVALGAGSASAVAADTVVSTNQDVQRTFTGTPSSGFVVIDGDNAQGDGSLLGRIEYAGQGINTNAQIEGEVYGDNTWASTNVSLPDLTDLILEIGPDTIIKQIDIPTLLNNLLVDDLITDIVNILQQLNPDQTQIDAIKTLVEALLGQVDLGIPSSFVLPIIDSLLSDPKEQDIRDLLGLLVDLNQVDTVADLLAAIDPSIVDLTPADVEQQLLNLDYASLLGDIGIDISASQITGDFDPSAGLVTAPIQDPDVAISYKGSQVTSLTLPLSLNLTTGQSGSMTGSTSGLDTDSGTATLVENEFTLGLPGIETLIKGIDLNSLLLDILQNSSSISLPDVDLPALLGDIDPNDLIGNLDISQILGWYITDQSGRHYLQLVMDLAFGATETLVPLSGTVTDGSGNSVTSVTIEFVDTASGQTVTTVTTDNSGSYSVELDAGEYDVVVNADGYESFSQTQTFSNEAGETFDFSLTESGGSGGPPALAPSLGPPQDRDGDGLYEDVRGKGGPPSVLDVQTLFNNLNNPDLQQNSDKFNFQGSDPSQVSILDVQALFNDI